MTRGSNGSSPLPPEEGRQTRRILWLIPNYAAVSVDDQVPKLTNLDKFTLATADSLDYSAFIRAGAIAGVGQAVNRYPQFGQGSKGFTRYWWHSVADSTGANYMTQFVLPTAFHQDPRYYTLGRGGFFMRLSYAISRLAVTRTDEGPDTFNSSEFLGQGVASGLGAFYYPDVDRTWTKTGQRWLVGIGLDGFQNVVKEFWPDINHKIFHQPTEQPHEGPKLGWGMGLGQFGQRQNGANDPANAKQPAAGTAPAGTAPASSGDQTQSSASSLAPAQ